MNIYSTNHSLICTIDHVDFQSMKSKREGVTGETIAGPAVEEIREAITDGDASVRVSLAMLQRLHAKNIHDAVAAAISDGCMVTVQQVRDPTKHTTFDGKTVKSLGMGFGMTMINVRPARDFVREGYAMQTEREAFKPLPIDHAGYRDAALESDITAGKIATGTYFPK